MVLLLLTGRCYEPEICAILLPLKYAFAWYRFLLSQSFQFLANIIVRGLIFANVLQKACRSKGKRKEKCNDTFPAAKLLHVRNYEYLSASSTSQYKVQ